jgi:hypothetical protein
MDLITRAKNILTSPKTEWPVIAAEPADTAGLYSGYIVPLAAIGPVALLISLTIFMGVGTAISLAIGTFVSNLIGVFIMALVVAKLAPSFGGRDDMGQALKLVAYSHTAAWIASLLFLFPLLALLVLLAALYGVYLYYLGAPATVGVPQEKAAVYTLVSIVVVVVVSIALRYLLALIVGGRMAMM